MTLLPTANNSTFNQFVTPVGTGAFRAHRFPLNYKGFDDVTFNNSSIIENVNSVSENCAELLSVNNLIFNNLSIFPNPTKDILNFNFEKPINIIQVYTIMGKAVLSKSNSNFINLENLDNGMYLIKIGIDEEYVFTKVLKK